MVQRICTAQPMIAMTSISKTFAPGTASQREVFRDFSFQVREGQFVTILGGNGSGKTTLLNLLGGDTAADEGQIHIGGREVGAMAAHERARFLGRVSQDPARGTCQSLTLYENMALTDRKGKPYRLGPWAQRGRLSAYRAMVSSLGLGLEDGMHQVVGNLSGGQRQALALLLCTMTPLRLLLLDEHTAALDPKASEHVMALTERLIREKGLTALMVTHNLRHALRYGDRLVMLKGGRIAMDREGQAKQALTAEDLSRAYHDLEEA